MHAYVWFVVAILQVTSAARRTDKPVVFPVDVLSPTKTSPPLPQKIPERLLIKMRNVHNASDFIQRFASVPIVPTTEKDKPGTDTIVGRKPPVVVGLKANSIFPPANCETSLQVVELEKPRDPTTVYWPMCVRVARCNGCCPSDLLECVATKKSKQTINVLEAKYMGGDSADAFTPVGIKPFNLEKHDKCTCQCKQRAEHCGPLQIYRPEECRCLCTNKETERKCNSPDKVWDLKDCVCKCKSVNECSTGFFFNPTTCRCENLRSPLRPSIISRLLAAPPRSTNETLDIYPVPASDVDPFRDDGGENDGHRRRDIGIRPPDSEGMYSLARRRIRGRTRPVVPINDTMHEEED